MEDEATHLRTIRPKRRKKIPNGSSKSDAVEEVFTLCGKWVAKRRAVRVDRRLTAGNVCDACRAVAS